MSASPEYRPEHFLSKPLERRMRDHMSRQMTYALHSSSEIVPPHLLSGSRVAHRVAKNRNIHPEAFHAGTPAASWDMTGDEGFRHLYRIHRSVMDPALWGDENVKNLIPTTMSALNVIPRQLFEAVPLHHEDIEKNINPRRSSMSPLVQAYRNATEDPGSISFVIPKSLIGSGVEYLGSVLAPREAEAAAEWQKEKEKNERL